MSDQHFTYFKVENFKRFDALELTDIGQFNLIVGDNNVGKTSVLEALAVMYTSEISYNKIEECLDNLWQVLVGRKIVVEDNMDLLFKYSAKDYDKAICFESYRRKLRFTKKGLPLILVETTNGPYKEERGTPKSITNKNAMLPLVRTYIPMEDLYKEYQNTINFSRSTKRSIVNSLKIIDKNITDIEVLGILEQQHVMIGFESDNDKYMPISSLGESAVRAFYYFLQIIKNQGQFLCIDEIDTGIHYSRMKEFLKQIIQTAVNNDVQLFLTTHSLECQEAFAEVFDEPDMVQHQPKVRQYTLIEKTDGQVSAHKFNLKQLDHALEIGFDTRGGERA